MKKLHTFQVNYRVAEEDKTRNVIIAKPSPRQLEEGEMEYAGTISNFVRKGVMTRAMLYKQYEDKGGGILPEHVQEKIYKAKLEYATKAALLTKLEAKKEKDITAEDRIEKAKLTSEILELQTELVNAETAKDSVYNISADKLTMDKMIFWWIFELVRYQDEESDEIKKIFNKESYEANKEMFYQLEEDEDAFWNAAKNRIFGMVWFLYYNQGATSDDFARYEKEYFPVIEQQMAAEDAKEAEVAAEPETEKPKKARGPKVKTE